jgi:hypothetical protein
VDAVTVGVLGQQWRASVTPWGAVEIWDGIGRLDWYVAADDRWHVPADEPTVRQRTIDGTPVVETRLRIPSGDAVQRVYAVADHGGLTIVEVENDSPLPIAVAFTGPELCAVRPPTDVPIQGIDLSGPVSTFPVGHRSTLTVALVHTAGGPRVLPSGLPPAPQVARGWITVCERASRLLLPDESLAGSVVRARCELLLCGPDEPSDDPVGFLLGVGELVRMGSRADDWMPDVAEAVGALGAHLADSLLEPAIDAAARVCHAASDERAARDLERVRHRLLADRERRGVCAVPSAARSGARLIAAVEGAIATGPVLLPGGLPQAWLGQHLEVYGVPTGAASAVSFALRWHGERPALLWEQTGEAVLLTAPIAAPEWSTALPTGEALWPTPAGAMPVPSADEPLSAASADDAGDISFG